MPESDVASEFSYNIMIVFPVNILI